MCKTPRRHCDSPFPLRRHDSWAGGSSWYLFRLAATFSVFGLPSRLRFSLVGSHAMPPRFLNFFMRWHVSSRTRQKPTEPAPALGIPAFVDSVIIMTDLWPVWTCCTYEARGMCYSNATVHENLFSLCSRALTRTEIAFIPAGGASFPLSHPQEENELPAWYLMLDRACVSWSQHRLYTRRSNILARPC